MSTPLSGGYWDRQWQNIPCSNIQSPIHKVSQQCPADDNGDYLWHGRCNYGQTKRNRFNRHLMPRCQKNRGRLNDMVTGTSCTPDFLKTFVLSQDFSAKRCEYKVISDDPFVRNISQQTSGGRRPGKGVPLLGLQEMQNARNWQDLVEEKKAAQLLMGKPHQTRNYYRKLKKLKWFDELEKLYNSLGQGEDTKPGLDKSHLEMANKQKIEEEDNTQQIRFKVQRTLPKTPEPMAPKKKRKPHLDRKPHRTSQESYEEEDYLLIPLKARGVFHEPYDKEKPWTYAQGVLKLPSNFQLNSLNIAPQQESSSHSVVGNFNSEPHDFVRNDGNQPPRLRPSEGFRHFASKIGKDGLESFVASSKPTYPPPKRPYFPGVDLRDPKTIYEEYLQQVVPLKQQQLLLSSMKSSESLSRSRSQRSLTNLKRRR